MADHQSAETKETLAEQPAPETLQPQTADGQSADQTGQALSALKVKRQQSHPFRPSHKATYLGIAAVVVILLINGGAIALVINSQSNKHGSKTVDSKQVTISSSTLSKLGVNSAPSGNSADTQLIISPNSQFKGYVQVASNLTIGGTANVNNKLTAGSASISQLQAGTTSFDQLNVNGDGTVNTLNTRKDLNVSGQTRLQGPVVASQLVTLLNSLNVSGNLAIGGTLTARNFEATNLQSDTTLTIGGHIITRGSSPSVSPGSALGSNGTVSISGNDSSGTVAVNIGTNAGSGLLATVTFRTPYGSTPHVVVTPIGAPANIYISRSSNGFSIYISGGLPPGGYAVDYIVMQ